jgi:hypothetical protein
MIEKPTAKDRDEHFRKWMEDLLDDNKQTKAEKQPAAEPQGRGPDSAGVTFDGEEPLLFRDEGFNTEAMEYVDAGSVQALREIARHVIWCCEFMHGVSIEVLRGICPAAAMLERVVLLDSLVVLQEMGYIEPYYAVDGLKLRSQYVLR